MLRTVAMHSFKQVITVTLMISNRTIATCLAFSRASLPEGLDAWGRGSGNVSCQLKFCLYLAVVS